MAMLLSEFDFLPIYRADLAGSRTLSFAPVCNSRHWGKLEEKLYNIIDTKHDSDLNHNLKKTGTDFWMIASFPGLKLKKN